MESSLPPRLKDLLYQLSKVPSQIEQEWTNLLQSQSALAPVLPPGDVTPEKSELTELRQKIQQAKAEHQQLATKNDELAGDLERWEDDISKADAQHKQLVAESEAAKLQIQRFGEEQQEIETHRALYQEIIDRAQVVQMELQTREQNIMTAESAMTERERAINERAEHLECTRYWLESLLPVWLQEESISLWRDALMDDAQHPHAASTSAGLLFSTLSLYTYAQRDTDARAVADALRDVGRRLFTWLRERDLGEYEASTVAQVWADFINRECVGRCEVEVPVPGSPAQNQTMLYQPRPGASSQTVVYVQSWCVRGAKREVIHRAIISV